MPERLRGSRSDLEALIGRTADAFDIPAEFAEKDFWAIETLRAARAACSAAGVTFVFKGGTSLSRAYGLIERFSEDIDVTLGFGADVTRGARDRLLAAIRDAVGEHLGVPHIPVAHGKGTNLSARYAYEPASETSGQLSEGVLLELGCRAGLTPVVIESIHSLVAKHAIEDLGEAEDAWEEFAPITLDVMRPERTLWEKLFLLGGAEAEFSEKPEAFARHGRHLYDISRVLGDKGVQASIDQMPVAERAAIWDDIYERSLEGGFPTQPAPRPVAGFGSLQVFVDGSEAANALRAAYTGAAPLIYGQVPSFDECLRIIKENADRI